MNHTDSQAAADAPRPARRFRDRFKGDSGTDNAQQAATLRSLSRTLDSVDHELQLLSHASKYNWINQRLILLRNALIAVSVLIVVVVAAVACYREAYRQTLTIAAFDVPPKLAERGITGQVIAKALFDELIKRRELVTTLEKGELKGAWAENRADVAIPEAKFTLQSVFRYLRYMTGNEISVDGEFILDGDDVTMKVRVAGKPPTVVKGKLADWETLTGDLANGVLEVTQPAVLAAYLGLKAETPRDLANLSKRMVAMRFGEPKLDDAVMAVAYDAYGSALRRQGRTADAIHAFAEAMNYDPTNGVAVMNAANTQYDLRNFDEAAALFQKAQALRLPDSVKRDALIRRVYGATTLGDCEATERWLKEARASPVYDAHRFILVEASYTARCDYEEARAVATLSKFVAMHPENANAVNALAVLQLNRPENRYLDEAISVRLDAIAGSAGSDFPYANIAYGLVLKDRIDEGRELYKRAQRARPATTDPDRYRYAEERFESRVHFQQKEYAKADEFLRRTAAKVPLRERQDILFAANVKRALGKFDEAMAVYEDGLKRLPKSCQLWEGMGGVLEARGDVPAALTTYDKGIAAVPKCGLNYNSAARLLIKQNRIPEAKQKLEALIKIAPNSDGAVIAKEILETLPK